MDDQPMEAKPHKQLIGEIMNVCRAKSEHEWAASREITELKQKIVNMRTECNKRYSEQLQKIRKLEAEKMMQIQDTLFGSDE